MTGGGVRSGVLVKRIIKIVRLGWYVGYGGDKSESHRGTTGVLAQV